MLTIFFGNILKWYLGPKYGKEKLSLNQLLYSCYIVIAKIVQNQQQQQKMVTLKPNVKSYKLCACLLSSMTLSI